MKPVRFGLKVSEVIKVSFLNEFSERRVRPTHLFQKRIASS